MYKEYRYYDEQHKIDIFIVPWTLPRENMPMYIKWPAGLEITSVNLIFPVDLNVEEILNVKEESYILKQYDKMKILKVYEVNRPSLKDAPFYFGVIFKLDKIPEDIKYIKKITTILFKDNKEFLRKTIYARVFRPKIKIVKKPSQVKILENQPIKIPLHLKYFGFGEVTLKLKLGIGGRIVSHQRMIIYEIMKRLVEMEDRHPVDKTNEIKVNPKYVSEIIEEIENMLRKQEFPKSYFTDEEYRSIVNYLNKLSKEGKLAELIYSQVHNILIDLLLELFEMYPNENVEFINPKMRLLTDVETPIDEISLVLEYNDLVGNIYKEETKITSLDMRQHKVGKHPIGIDLSVDKWEADPLINVENIPFGENI